MDTSPQPFEFNKSLKQHETIIQGLIIYDLTVLGDNRGWFKENWQREKMLAIGLPDFGPVQNNFSFNGKRGTMRGIHAEPWDKFISVGSGRFFGAWVDVREDSKTYGQLFTAEIDPTKAIFVPAGIANSYLTLEDNTVYSYLVNDHWYPDAKYTFVNATDPNLNIEWPIPPSDWEWSEKDKNHPMLKDITPVKPKKILVTGANGQVGRALRGVLPGAEFVTREEFDISDPAAYESRHWRDYQAIINTAAYNAVDAAETDRENCWKVNAIAPKLMAKVAAEYNLTLMHFGTDYEFDGTKTPHVEDETPSPLSAYAASKAAGVIAVTVTPKYYVLRVSWVIGEGKNFVRTMQSLAEKGIKPSVVDDQVGRLTFANDIAAAVKHLLDSNAPYGIYNLSNDGPASTWADVAKKVYELSDKPADDVTPVTTEEYYKDKQGIAPRPPQSMLSLDKIKATGFILRDWRDCLKEYLAV